MQRETSNDSFLDYGSVYHQPIDREHPELIHQTMVAITRRYVSQFYCFNCDTYLQVKSGIGVLLVSHTAEAADVQEFAMNRLIHIRQPPPCGRPAERQCRSLPVNRYRR